MSKSLYQPLRQGQLSVGSAWRAYYAPFNKVAALASSYSTVGPRILDLQNQGPFSSETLLNASLFYDCGLCGDIKPTNGTKFGSIKTGSRNMTRAMYVGDVSETLDVTFMERSRTVDRISSGMQVFNLLENNAFAGTLTGPLSASGTAALSLASSGYLANGVPGTNTAGSPTLLVAAGSGAMLSAGQYIVCDQDYTPGTSGYVGDAAALVIGNGVTDVDFIRKTSDYVARIVGIVPTVIAGFDAVVLNAPFVGGGNNIIPANATYAPGATAKIQVIKGTVRRNGGSKIAEWTGLFLLDTDDGSQFAMYYPRLVSQSVKGLQGKNITDATGLSEFGMQTTFEALAFDDPLDGESVVSYTAYYPSSGQSIQI
jgi:hypothetical protein